MLSEVSHIIIAFEFVNDDEEKDSSESKQNHDIQIQTLKLLSLLQFCQRIQHPPLRKKVRDSLCERRHDFNRPKTSRQHDRRHKNQISQYPG